MTNYILEGKQPVKCDDIIQWGKWFETGDRVVAKTEKDGVSVSTVFLGIDHSFEEGEPVLFETMIFGGDRDEDMWRYSTWDEAEKGHAEACRLAGM